MTQELNFALFKTAVQKQLATMTAASSTLFTVNLNKDTLWQKYLDSFPAGTNPIYKERTEHDCNCCKHFIRSVGNVVAIINNKLVSIWEIDPLPETESAYNVVANALAAFVKSHPVNNLFLTSEKTVGPARATISATETSYIAWDHFSISTPKKCVASAATIGPKQSAAASAKQVFKRGLEEISFTALDCVLELISQNSLYRGTDYQASVQRFKELKEDAPQNEPELDLYSWKVSATETFTAAVLLRNSAIGKLLLDISADEDLETAVKSFESIVAPANYKRPKAIVTKQMLELAKKTITDLGYMPSLTRRYAALRDVSVNNVLFVDRNTRPQLNNSSAIFDQLVAELPVNPAKQFSKVEEVSLDKFLSDILPQAKTLELFVDNKHTGNFVGLVTADDPTSKPMFKWDNTFSWAYTGDVTDSIKEKVKAAGGNVTGYLRCSLSWYNTDDLDLHIREYDSSKAPRAHICYCDRVSKWTRGQLDVDMNAGSGRSTSPVENICYPEKKKVRPGTYSVSVNQYARRNSNNVGFTVEIECDGVIKTYTYNNQVSGTISVADINVSNTGEISIVDKLPESTASKTVWNIPTQTFQKVNVVMNSPNYWDNNAVGNKHVFFMLENCHNDGPVRGFFNEYLSNELTPHRKALEFVGSKLLTENASEQLCGLGFSLTKRDSIIVKVTGTIARTFKVLI